MIKIKHMITIRPLQESDNDREIGQLFSQLTNRKTSSVSLDALLSSNTICIAVLDNDKIIGFGSLAPYYVPTVGEVGAIEDIIIDEKYRGQGLGQKLIEELIKIAKDKNLLKLKLTSNPTRTSARSLYKKLGFEMKDTDIFVKELL